MNDQNYSGPPTLDKIVSRQIKQLLYDGSHQILQSPSINFPVIVPCHHRQFPMATFFSFLPYNLPPFPSSSDVCFKLNLSILESHIQPRIVKFPQKNHHQTNLCEKSLKLWMLQTRERNNGTRLVVPCTLSLYHFFLKHQKPFVALQHCLCHDLIGGSRETKE